MRIKRRCKDAAFKTKDNFFSFTTTLHCNVPHEPAPRLPRGNQLSGRITIVCTHNDKTNCSVPRINYELLGIKFFACSQCKLLNTVATTISHMKETESLVPLNELTHSQET